VTADGLAEFAAQYLSEGKNFQTISVMTAGRWSGMNNCVFVVERIHHDSGPVERYITHRDETAFLSGL
jgi:hypothetical protein